MQWGHYTIKSASQYLCTNPQNTFHLHEYVWDGREGNNMYIIYVPYTSIYYYYYFLIPRVLKDPRIGIS